MVHHCWLPIGYPVKVVGGDGPSVWLRDMSRRERSVGVSNVLTCAEKQYTAAEPHLLASGTRESAELLAQILFDWFSSSSEPKPESAGRYAARGTLSYLEAESILGARSFLTKFLDLLLAAHPSILFGRVASGADGGNEDFVITSIASLNYLQLAIRNCQVGIGECL